MYPNNTWIVPRKLFFLITAISFQISGCSDKVGNVGLEERRVIRIDINEKGPDKESNPNQDQNVLDALAEESSEKQDITSQTDPIPEKIIVDAVIPSPVKKIDKEKPTLPVVLPAEQDPNAIANDSSNIPSMAQSDKPTMLEDADCDVSEGDLNPVRVRRLSDGELVNTFKSFVGKTMNQYKSFDSKIRYGNFLNNATVNRVNLQTMTDLESLAEEIAAFAVKVPSDFFNCYVEGPEKLNRNCIDVFLNRFAEPLFRKRLSTAERDELVQKLEQFRIIAKTEKQALNTFARYLVLSPRSLYRMELGSLQNNQSGMMTDYEIASLLSYGLTGLPPDSELLALAEQGALKSPQNLSAQVDRLLASEASKNVLTNMVMDIFQVYEFGSIEKSKEKFPQYSETLKEDFREEAKLLIEHVVHEQNAGFPELLDSSITFANENIAKLYGIGNISGNDFQKVDLPVERSGMMTTPGMMALLSHETMRAPFQRGAFVLRQLQCIPLGPPEGAADAMVPSDPNLVTFRDKLTAQTAAPNCMGCHSLINPAGFAFENFDGIGVFKTSEDGTALDASGAHTIDQMKLSFGNAKQFLTEVAGSHQLIACSAQHAFRYLEGRFQNNQRDRCRINKAANTSLQSGNSLKQIIKELLINPEFYKREGI